MKAIYSPEYYSEESVEIDVDTVEDMAELIRTVHLQSDLSADEADGGVSVIILSGTVGVLILAPVDERIVLFYELDGAVEGYTSVDPSGSLDEEQTYWFSYFGSASEVLQRNSLSQDVAMAAVAQFMADPSTKPMVPGLDWEKDWDF